MVEEEEEGGGNDIDDIGSVKVHNDIEIVDSDDDDNDISLGDEDQAWVDVSAGVWSNILYCKWIFCLGIALQDQGIHWARRLVPLIMLLYNDVFLLI